MGRGVKKLIGRWQKFKKGRIRVITATANRKIEIRGGVREREGVIQVRRISANRKIRFGRESSMGRKSNRIGRARMNRKILNGGRDRSMRWVEWGRGRRGGGDEGEMVSINCRAC